MFSCAASGLYWQYLTLISFQCDKLNGFKGFDSVAALHNAPLLLISFALIFFLRVLFQYTVYLHWQLAVSWAKKFGETEQEVAVFQFSDGQMQISNRRNIEV